MKKISVIVPMYYEEKIVSECYNRLTSVLKNIENYEYEIIFINDGSKDKTLEMLIDLSNNDKNVKVISFSRNFGHQAAVTAGLQYVTGDAIVIIDSDLQDPPEPIPQMLEEWEKGYDDVYARRRSRAGETWFKKASAHWYYRILQKFADIEIPSDVGDFRLLDRQAVNALCSLREKQRYTKGLFSWIGYNKKELLFDRDPRAVGNSKMDLLKLLLKSSNKSINPSFTSSSSS